MTRIFVTTEYAPVVPGGAGAVVAGLAGLLRARGDEVRVQLIIDADHPDVGDVDGVTLTQVDPARDGGTDDPRSRFLARSRAAARAVAEIVADVAEPVVEFLDFDGLAFWALTHREELGLAAVPLTVRFHGPVDLMWEATGHGHPEWETVRVMERAAFELADAVLVPSPGVARMVVERYGVDPERVLVAPPPVPALPDFGSAPAPDPVLTVLGRLGEVKGSEEMVAASLRLLERRPRLTVRFAGADGWSAAESRPMREVLASRIPAEHRARFDFSGVVPRDDLPRLLADSWAVVVPSRFESFCLAAHEARRAGLPVVVPDLPAFEGLFTEASGALVFDGTVDGLVSSLDRLLGDPELRRRLADAPAPAVGDPLHAYDESVPAPRHPRVQAGLATAAVKRVEATIPEPPARRSTEAARRLLRHLPDPVARVAVRVLPQRVKDRFRQVADWRVEAERRGVEQARVDLRAKMARGDFAEESAPDVTVVIPCFNQGHLVEDAIYSVFAQTHPSWEIVVVDDGSTDPDTVAALDRLDFPRLRLVRQDNQGLPGARNTGIRMARGRYVVPLDADDELAPEFLARLLAAIENRPTAGYAHCWAELFGEQSAIWVSRPFNEYQLLLSNSVVGCVLLRRDAWEAVGGYAEDMTEGNEDWDLWLRLLAAGWDQVEVSAPLFRYRKHGISMSVETEARFERARAAMAARHPRLYELDALRARKAAHYPWVTLVVSPGSDVAPLASQTVRDAEVVPVGEVLPQVRVICDERGWRLREPVEDAAAAVAASRGKVVIEWSGVRAADPRAVEQLAGALESPGRAAGTVPAGWPHAVPFAWRRWALVDRDGPTGPPVTVDVDVEVGGAPRLSHGMAPQPGWDIRELLDTDLPVLRQSPEEEGPLPSWTTLEAGR